MSRRMKLGGLAAVVVTLGVAAGADAARHTSIRSALASQAQHGQQLTVTGRMVHAPRKARGRTRAVLQVRGARRWRGVARARLGRWGAFSIH